VLSQVGVAQGADMAEQIVSRVKVMAELDIAERRIPQDGRFKCGSRDARWTSVSPSCVHLRRGAVLRILDKQDPLLTVSRTEVDVLGFDEGTVGGCASLRASLMDAAGDRPDRQRQDHTLYAILSEIHNGRDKIITIEDPVEYQLPGILQIPVNEKKGLTFARGLRSILRHDPDKIMVGEIRDPETAQIAVQSALTDTWFHTRCTPTTSST